MEKREKVVLVLCGLFVAASGILHYAHANAVLAFVVTAAALALLAVMVGDATEQLGSRLGPGATGVLQSGLGNLPELFVCIFALRAGLDHVVQAALIGSILGNSLLVLGLALFLGGLRNGTQRFNSEPPKMIVALMLLASAVLVVPTNRVDGCVGLAIKEEIRVLGNPLSLSVQLLPPSMLAKARS